MGSFNDLPIDIVWIILRHAIVETYNSNPAGLFWETPNFSFAYNGYLSTILVPLSKTNKRIRRLLKAKCIWKNKHRFAFIKGAILYWPIARY